MVTDLERLEREFGPEFRRNEWAHVEALAISLGWARIQKTSRPTFEPLDEEGRLPPIHAFEIRALSPDGQEVCVRFEDRHAREEYAWMVCTLEFGDAVQRIAVRMGLDRKARRTPRVLTSEDRERMERLDQLLHPNGRCTCYGEGRCDLCRSWAEEEEREVMAKREAVRAEILRAVESDPELLARFGEASIANFARVIRATKLETTR